MQWKKPASATGARGELPQVPLPRQRPALCAALRFLLRLTKGGQGNGFSSLMVHLFCVSAIGRPRQDVMCFHLDRKALT